jgi:hypothetical protein
MVRDGEQPAVAADERQYRYGRREGDLVLALEGAAVRRMRRTVATMGSLLLLWPSMSTPADAAESVIQATVPPTWLPGEETEGDCNMNQQGRLSFDAAEQDDRSELTVEMGRAADGPFVVSQIGPSGSGHFWEIGVSLTEGAKVFGFCLRTETWAWRRIGGNPSLAKRMSQLIRPIQDIDRDRIDEFVIAHSVNAHDGSECLEGGECTISATAYDRRGQTFVANAASTRKLRSEMADAYNRAAAARRGRPSDRKYYAHAAALLKKLASSVTERGRTSGPRQ